jgi:hypothetical protein
LVRHGTVNLRRSISSSSFWTPANDRAGCVDPDQGAQRQKPRRAPVASLTGVSQTRVSPVEHGKITETDAVVPASSARRSCAPPGFFPGLDRHQVPPA